YSSSPAHRALHSFPTRRSSDLSRRENSVAKSLYSDDSVVGGGVPGTFSPFIEAATTRNPRTRETSASVASRAISRRITGSSRSRSEEHTSELQSLAYLVCRLLL